MKSEIIFILWKNIKKFQFNQLSPLGKTINKSVFIKTDT